MGTSFGAMMAQLMQPGQIERVDSLLWRMGLLEERRHARPFLRVNEVAGVIMANSKSSPIGASVRVQSASSKVDPVSVTINGVPLDNPGPLHMVMHKLPGTVCTHAEDEGETVYDALPEDALVRYPLLASVGRLDRLASGLLLFSQSGDLIHRLTSPESHVPRTYIVRLQNPLAGDGREALLLAMGTLRLIDGHTCKPAVLEPHPTDATAARITVFEGHHRLVRRAFSALGNRVLALHRSHFGPMDLAAMGLAPGESRRLSAAELYSLLEASARPTRRHLRAIERTRLKASRIAAVPEVPASLLEAVDRAAGLIGSGAEARETAPAALPPSDQYRRATQGRTRPNRSGASHPGGGQGQGGTAGPEGSDSDWVDLDELGSRMGLRSSAAELQSIAEQSPTFHEALVTAGPRDGVAVDAFVEARKAVASRSGWTQAGHASASRVDRQPGSDSDTRHSTHEESWEDLAANADGWGSDAWDDTGDLSPLADTEGLAGDRRGREQLPRPGSASSRQSGRSAAEVLRMRPSLGAGRPVQEAAASSAEATPARSRGRRKSVVRQAIEVGSTPAAPRRAAGRPEDDTTTSSVDQAAMAEPAAQARGPNKHRSLRGSTPRPAVSVREAGRAARAARAAKQEPGSSRR